MCADKALPPGRMGIVSHCTRVGIGLEMDRDSAGRGETGHGPGIGNPSHCGSELGEHGESGMLPVMQVQIHPLQLQTE